MRFAITIDTEVDKSRDWSVSAGETYEGIYRGVGDILQPMFDRHGVAPVYFLSNEILARKDLCEVFVPLGRENRAELATHLHYEAAGPFKLPQIAGRKLAGIQAMLSEEDERHALTWLTEQFDKRFGYMPVSFRAGRYGLGRNSIGILRELGYLVDSSVTPGLRWQYETSSGQLLECDYRAAKPVAYMCDKRDAGRKGNDGILQVPIGIQPAPLSARELLRLALGHNRRHIWARPGFASEEEYRILFRTIASHGGPEPIVVMMFHNMEVIPNASPYSSTEEEAAAHVSAIEAFIAVAREFGALPTTLDAYSQRYQELHS